MPKGEKAYFLLWNPDKWQWPAKQLAKFAAGKPVRDSWNTGNNNSVKRGEQFFLFAVGEGNRGVVGSGVFTSSPIPRPKYDGSGKLVPTADCLFETLLAIDQRLPAEILEHQIPSYRFKFQSSGVSITGEPLSRLRFLWEQHAASSHNLSACYNTEEVPGLYEGALARVYVNKYERNPIARRQCLKHFGYRCQACELNFVERYGEIGKDFIHVHHTKPVSAIGKSYKINPLNDLVPVCPNCHAMLHRKPGNTPYSIAELRQMIAPHQG